MTDTVLSKISRLLKELAEVVAAPSGDARGHVRDYRPKPVARDRL